jgi:hypothetical protein
MKIRHSVYLTITKCELINFDMITLKLHMSHSINTDFRPLDAPLSPLLPISKCLIVISRCLTILPFLVGIIIGIWASIVETTIHTNNDIVTNSNSTSITNNPNIFTQLLMTNNYPALIAFHSLGLQIIFTLIYMRIVTRSTREGIDYSGVDIPTDIDEFFTICGIVLIISTYMGLLMSMVDEPYYSLIVQFISATLVLIGKIIKSQKKVLVIIYSFPNQFWETTLGHYCFNRI